MKDDKRTKAVEIINQIERVEGTQVSNLRRLCESYFSRMTSIWVNPADAPEGVEVVNPPLMFKLAFLHKGTKGVKKLDGNIVDLVSKRHEWHESSVEGEPIDLLFLNERLGLSPLRTPLSNAEALRRYIGAIMHAMSERYIERRVSAKGVPINDTNFNNQLDRLGFRKWDIPSAHAEQFIALVSSKVNLPVESFEIAEPPKKDVERKVFKAEFRDEAGKVVGTATVSKSLYDAYRDKVSSLHISLIAADADALAKANKAAKAAEKDGRTKESIEDKLTREAELTKLAEEAGAVELLN